MAELLLERLKFEAKINKNSGRKVKELSECWLWKGSPHSSGYGNYQTNYAKDKNIVYAHQASYHIFKDNTYKPKRENPCSHLCESSDIGVHRLCVNPEHLILKSIAENVADRDTNHGSYQSIKTSGTKNGNAKFNQEQLAEIKEMRAKGMFYKDIAKKFECHHRTIERIFTGQHYS